MDTRKNAVNLSATERDKLLEAFIRLKNHQAPGAPAGVSIYDQFVALHGAVFAVIPPGATPQQTVNFGHWNIGFLPWHRMYLRQFEKALQAEVPGVTLPYWNWADTVGAANTLFTGSFLGSRVSGSPAPIPNSVFRNPVPVAQRPAWWPAGAAGFPIHSVLREGFGAQLRRGSVGVSWPPPAARIQQIENLVAQSGGHPLWYFWVVVEEGDTSITTRTHNTGHNFIGGHMSGGFSPNDPVFWFHHAFVDRIWARWQAQRLQAVAGSQPKDHWPAPTELSPIDGQPAPLGHRLDDAMWPWVGNAPGYDVVIAPAVRPLLPSFATAPAVAVRKVLDTATLDAVGYQYT